MYDLIASRVARAGAAHIKRACVVAMPRADEVGVNVEVSEADLKRKALPRVVVSASVRYQCEVVRLQHEAEVDENAEVAAEQHASLG